MILSLFTVSPVMPPKSLEQKIPALLKFFARRNVSHWDAEDLVQEVLYKLLAMGRSPITEQDGYLFTVARTLLIDKYRSDTRKKALLISPLMKKTSPVITAPIPSWTIWNTNLSACWQSVLKI